MRDPLRRWRLPAACVLALLAAIVPFVHAGFEQSETGHDAALAMLHRLKQVDASWELSVMKSRLGLTGSYDPLVAPVVEIREVRQRLKQALADIDLQSGPDRDDLALDVAFGRKVEIVERFKTENSILRNSLTFLPLAAQELREAIAQSSVDPDAALRQRHDVNQTLLASLIFAHEPSHENAATVETLLGRLAAAPALTSAVTEQADVFALHIRTVLQKQPTVNDLLDAIAAVPTAALIDELDGMLSRMQRDASLRVREQRAYLLRFAALLAVLLLSTAAGLIRSHVTIKRVNRKLLSANAELEHRVEARTHDLNQANEHLQAALEASRRNEERYRTLVERLPDGILIERNGEIVFVNRAACQLFLGSAPEDLLGRPIDALLAIGAHEGTAASDDRSDDRWTLVEGKALLPDGATPDVAITRLDMWYEGRRAQQFIVKDISESKRLRTQLEHLATHDALTQLPNRALMRDRLDCELAQAKRNSRSFMVAAIDLDRFKWVNDTLGHAAGDELLQTTTSRIRQELKGSDTLARVGGDEFVIILHDLVDFDQAVARLRRIVAAVSRTVVFRDGAEASVSCSVGCSTYPDDGTDADELLRAADIAMYQAKQAGRDTLQIFNADLRRRAALRTSLEIDLRHAVERRELSLVYQPQVDLRTGAIAGVEALLRWHSPRHGDVSPALFIPVAEASGHIVPIGEWVLFEACRQMREWIDAGVAPRRIAVNLSAKQLSRPSFLDQVQSRLARFGLDPSRLELELTETASMDDPDRTVPLMVKLKELGVGIAIDDFGTGYSNMQYLTRLPIDTLKIDGAFVREITSDAGQLAITEAVINMSHRLGLGVVAEKAETEEQVRQLQELGCDLVQGYFFSPPMTEAECRIRLSAGRFALPCVQEMEGARRIELAAFGST